jgi:FkbM family methyltransferase
MLEREFAGVPMRLWIENLFGHGWYGHHHDGWRELDWLRDSGVRKGDIVVDCGANQGMTTVFFAKLVGPSGFVIAVEPIPSNLKSIRRNLELNEILNAEVFASAAGGSVSEMSITDMSNATLRDSVMPRGRKVLVPVTPLDRIVGDRRVDFLKIDVEGFELEVLRGARTLLKGGPNLDLEIHVPYFDDKMTEVTEILAELPLAEYRMFVQKVVDGPIEETSLRGTDLVREIAGCSDVVHLFCQRLTAS